MCRLYGFRANESTKVECTLVYAQNALLVQSRSDRRGVSHADGWGIAHFPDGDPVVELRDTAAFADVVFSNAAERVHASAVVAHVRKATVGKPWTLNTHPFVHGRWVFAHNGTVTGFETVGPGMVAETDPDLQELRRGTTDSEQAFYWLLTRFRRAGIDLAAPGDLDRIVEVVGASVALLAARSGESGAEKEPQLNFLITDGRILVVSRWNNDLYWVRRQGVHDCEICGIPHIDHESKKKYRAVVVASEPISHEDWTEVPDAHVIAVDEKIEVELHPISKATRAANE